MPISFLRPRLATRSLLRAPGFTTAAVLLLGLGVGMATAMFTVYRAVLVQRLPVIDQERLIVMHPLDRGGAHLDIPAGYLDLVRRQSRTTAAIGGAYHLGAIASPLRLDDKTLDLTTGYVTANLFDVLGVRPLLGRLLRPEDGDRDTPQVIVLSYTAWRRVFGEDPGIIGRSLLAAYDGSRRTIVGVAPPGFEYPAGADAWQPFTRKLTAQVDIVARLARGASLSSARADLLAITREANPFLDSTNTAFRPSIAGVDARPFAQEVLGGVRPALVGLASAVGLLLVIACVNVGSLLIVRGAGREREFAVRRAIGASALDLAAQLIVENTLLGLAGGLLGLIVAEISLRVLLYVAPAQLPRADVIRLDGAPLGVAIATTMLALLVFGLLPAASASRTSPGASLRSDARAGGGLGQRRLRQWLVSSQIALAVVMVAGALLLGRSLARLQSLDLGYVPERLSLLRLDGPESVYTSPERALQFVNGMVAQIEAVPGVVAATVVESPPFKGQSGFIMKVSKAGLSQQELEASPYVPFEIAGPDYFRTLGIPILRGRGFLPSDTKTRAHVFVVSEALAQRLWPGEDAVGKRMRNAYDSLHTDYTVIGVARDTHFRDLRQAAPVVYQSQVQDFSAWFGYIAVRTAGDIAPLLPAIGRNVRDAYPGMAIVRVQTMEHLLDGPLAQPRMSTFLLSVFGVVALGLAAIGLYGVMSSAVRQRTREIGIRIALGATEGRVRRAVLGEAMAIVGGGIVVGLAGALIATQLLRTQLFGVSPADPLSFGAACAALAVVGLSAAYFPARYATRIDPARALRRDG
jgi:putative ABC transport system permease protein